MANNTRPIQFLDYLPEVFQTELSQTDEVNKFFSRYLKAFEAMFEELQSELEGAPDRTQGGIPDLFSPNTTPPPQFRYRPQSDFDYLNYLASWIAVPLRPEKPLDFNRKLFTTAIVLYRERSTLPGMEALLRTWLKGDLLETDPPLLILTDLTRTYNDVDTIFQLAPENDADKQPNEIYAQLSVNTVLGEGSPFFFIVDLIADPTVQELHSLIGLETFQQAARFLLDAEKPAYTYYQLRVRTTSTWDDPWIFNSDR